MSPIVDLGLFYGTSFRLVNQNIIAVLQNLLLQQ